MKFRPIDPPRRYKAGKNNEIEIKDCARIELAPDEQVTFVTESGTEYDVARKSWGYYATPSLNNRLVKYGLRGALVKGEDGKVFVYLMEKGREADFSAYMEREKMRVLEWLDGIGAGTPACLCGSRNFETVFVYTSPPEGEIRFRFSASDYSRRVVRCQTCGHFLSLHSMGAGDLYQGEYVDSTYGDLDGIRRNFERIVGLPPEKSDNHGRVARIVAFWESGKSQRPGEARPAVLDVGSGLCVFLHKMKEAGWDGTALDPDARAVDHARRTVGVSGVCDDFMAVPDLGRFDLITLNKVLEHVEDPVRMLAKCAGHLNPGGLVYVELPDGECAVHDGPGREEFFIDHLCVFSLTSLSLLATQAGFRVLKMERLREPSGKYTLFGFLTRPEI